ncbi:MAG: alginate export family protein [Bacteroidales bacterium]|nr:alginate export family protein [Bacteroidales bacterium]
MKNSIYYNLLLLLLVVGFFPIQSRAQFVIDASIRPRAEVRYGYKELARSDKEPVLTISQRTRLGVLYQSEKIKAKITFQDIRVWGDETQYSSTGVHGDVASIDLTEAWLSFNLTKSFSLTAGRQALSFDDERLLAKRNWNQNALFYDAVTMNFQSGKTTVDAGFSYNNAVDKNFMEIYDPIKMKTLCFLHLSQKFNPKFNATVITMFSGFTSSDTALAVYLKGTSGVNLNFNSNPWKVFSSFYFQYAKDTYGGNITKVAAYNVNVQVEYKLKYILFQMGGSLLSGDKNGDSQHGETHLFDLFYGARHKYYGFLDYFSNLRKDTKSGGLNDIYATVGVPVTQKAHVFATAHAFYLNRVPTSLSKPNTNSDKSYLGTELDFWLNADVMKGINIQTGYSFMLPGNQLKRIQGVSGNNPFSSWAWVMVTFSVKSKEL